MSILIINIIIIMYCPHPRRGYTCYTQLQKVDFCQEEYFSLINLKEVLQ